MADEPKPGQAPTKPKPGQTPAAKPPKGKIPDEKLTPTKARKIIEDSRKEAIRLRKQLKELKEGKSTEDTKAAEERGEYKALYEQAKGELERIKPEVADLKQQVADLAPFRDTVETSTKAAREAALQKLPEELREKFTSADVETIEAVAARMAAPGTSPDAIPATPATPPPVKGAGDNVPERSAYAGVPRTGGIGELYDSLNKNKG